MRFVLVAAVLGIAATTLSGVAAITLLPHDPISTKVTWEGEIKRLVEARCVSCHSEGGRAPMPLTTYEEARPWARAIREEVLTRRMPKWHVVRGYGDFTNDPSLSPFEVALFAAWADGGAPRVLPAVRPTVGPTFRPGENPAVGPTFRSGERSGNERAVEVPCSARSFPIGQVVAVRPSLKKGADLKVTVTGSDGSQEPLLWLRNFDPAFAETYRLRRPLQVTRATRVEMDGEAPCTVTVLLAAQTAR
jgi:hypothetical protein